MNVSRKAVRHLQQGAVWPGPRATQPPRTSFTLLLAIPFDLAGLYFALAALGLVPLGWLDPALGSGSLLAVAFALWGIARLLALLSVRRWLYWRVASDGWRRLAKDLRRPRGASD